MKGGFRAQRRENRAAAVFAAISAWAVGILLQFHPTLLSGLRRMQSDWGDTRLNNYILEHGYRWLFGLPGHERFWSPPVFFPAPNTAAYSDVLLGVAPLYWIWRLFGIAPDTAFQLWMLTVATLNFASAYLLFARGFKCRPLGSSVGAMLLSFAAVRTAQVMHAQLLAHFYIVLAILALLEIFEPEPELRAGVTVVAPRRVWVALLAAAIVAQIYSSFYYGWYLCFALALAAAWATVLPATRRRFFITVRSNARALVASAIAAALLLAPLATHYLQAERQLGTRKFIVVETMLPRLQSWAYQGPSSWLYGWLASYPLFHNLPMEHEQRLGLGLATVICGVIGLWLGRRRRAVQLVVLVSLTMALVATEWPGGFTPWRAVYLLVPGAAALRAVARIGVALVVPASLGVAILVDAVMRTRRVPPSRTAVLLRRRDRQRRAALLLALVAIIVAEQVQVPRSYDKNEGRARVARVASGIGADCGAFLYTTTGGDDDPWNYHADAMWASMERGIPTLNGYSGNQPPNWTFYDIRVSTPFLDSVVTDSVSRWASRWRIDPARICRVRTPPG
ncbi:MAG TPA: hypothetical protein VGO46_13020 [Gemmatimonadaceae bacterium]|nr:hypothetical protein [Gemmatimonadaceae bacterium]